MHALLTQNVEVLRYLTDVQEKTHTLTYPRITVPSCAKIQALSNLVLSTATDSVF